MEVSRRRILQKHLEPARPLRRCIHVSIEPRINVATCAQVLREQVDQKTNVGVEQVCKTINLHKQKQGRISYTRDFLIGLASCPAARKKPEFLPEHPIVLIKARDPCHIRLHELRLDDGKEDMATERLHAP